MPVVTKENLSKLPNVTDAAAKRYAEPLRLAMVKFNITTPARICAFLANVIEESGAFNFSHELWGPTPQQKKYEPPSEVAKRLGNSEFGDGKRYLGRGLFSITGRANYAAVSKALGVDFVNVPLLLEHDDYACLSAAWFWSIHHLNEFADHIDFEKPIDQEPNLTAFKAVVRVINGGLTHLAERIQNYKEVRSAFYGK